MSNIFKFSVGKKLIVSLAGLFLITFLIVHLGINMLLIFMESNEAFNKAAHFMATNKIIKSMEIILFGGFLVHIIFSVVVNIQNMLARPIGYKVKNNSQTSFFSKYMFHTAFIIAIFLVLHLFDFYLKAKLFGDIGEVIYDGEHYHDLGTLVIARFKIWWVDVIYIIALLALGFHLHHGFQSAFQTIGLNHPVYTPIVKAIGVIYSVIVTVGFISIPIVIYFLK